MFIILQKIIEELAKAEDEGLSYYDVYKKLTNHHGMDINKVAPRYHLEKMKDKGLVEKRDSKYVLESDAIAFDGAILFTEPPLMVNCPYSDSCDVECMSKECKLYTESSEGFQGILDDIIDKK